MGPQNGATVFAMRHGNRLAKLSKPADQRKALIRSLVTEVTLSPLLHTPR